MQIFPVRGVDPQHNPLVPGTSRAITCANTFRWIRNGSAVLATIATADLVYRGSNLTNVLGIAISTLGIFVAQTFRWDCLMQDEEARQEAIFNRQRAILRRDIADLAEAIRQGLPQEQDVEAQDQ